MNKFEIIDLGNGNKYQYAIINREANSITSSFNEIEQLLQDKKYSGKVLISNLTFCRNFDKSFSEIKFEGNQFKASTWTDIQLKDLEKEVIKQIKEYYKKNPDILIDSILPEVKE